MGSMIFHHVGLACRSIEAELSGMESIGYTSETGDIEDPIQKVRIRFMIGGGPRVELIEPLSQESPIRGLIKRGTRLYHLAYEAADFGGQIAALERLGYRSITAPVPAVAFGMRHIVFMMSATQNLIELIESGPG